MDALSKQPAENDVTVADSKPAPTKPSGGDLFIVDNSDAEWKVRRYLRDWCQLSERIDIATGYFEIGSLLALDGEWQKVDQIRLLMGDEVSLRTKRAFDQGLRRTTSRLDQSIEAEKEKNDFLKGVPAIVEAIREGKITCRVYRKDKFHAKAYITHARLEVVGSTALVGSSNFTFPGLTENIELNVQITGRPVNALQEWYERHWDDAEDITLEILKTIERHTRDFLPFEVYAKALYELFRRYDQTDADWEQTKSQVYPILSQYQRDGYHGMLNRGARYGGAFLCDGVGLGKTFIGLMLIERLVLHDRQNVALFVPLAGREAVWEATLERYLPEVFEGYYGFKIFNHTDLLRTSDRMPLKMQQLRDQVDVIIIDEAHHFRNTGTKGENEGEHRSRYWQMFDLCGENSRGQNKQVYMLTATPINNRLTDLQHMIELFSRGERDYFKDAPLGIHSLPGHIRTMEKALEKAAEGRSATQGEADPDIVEAEEVLRQDQLFRTLVVQRSRAYVKKSMKLEGNGEVLFPKPSAPKVQPYSVKQTYGKLLGMIEDAFHKEHPLFVLTIYYPWEYYKHDLEEIEAFVKGRQKQIVRLIRIQFLKRFESSAAAFEMSCRTLLLKLMAWIEIHNESQSELDRFERWKRRHADLIGYVHEKQGELFPDKAAVEEADEDVIPAEFLDGAEERKLKRDDFDIPAILDDAYNDLDQIIEFLHELRKFKPKQDKKLSALLKLLRNNSVLKKHKVLIFTEYMTTARYLHKQLAEAGIDNVEEIDSTRKVDRGQLIRRFSPYYNGSSSQKLEDLFGSTEIRILISTDVLSEGLNLQDCTRLINYDIHWNPVRLMQRIGRVDRRLNPDIEAAIIADHPDTKTIRGTIAYWNFLPPDDLEVLLGLYRRVSHKTLRISKTLGIEGKKLLSEDDDFQDLKNFTDLCEGVITPLDALDLELQKLLKEHPDLEERLLDLPRRIFSCREHPSPEAQAVFFCYARPALDENLLDEDGNPTWTTDAGDIQWYLYTLGDGEILDEPAAIANFIRSTPDTPRKSVMDQDDLVAIRKKMDKHLKNTYLKKVQAPVGVNPVLVCWMELN